MGPARPGLAPLFCRWRVLSVAFNTELVQGLNNAVQNFRLANIHTRFLLCHLKLTGIVFPAVQNLDFLIPGKLVGGDDFVGILEHHRGVQHSLFDIYHDSHAPPMGRLHYISSLFSGQREYLWRQSTPPEQP